MAWYGMEWHGSSTVSRNKFAFRLNVDASYHPIPLVLFYRRKATARYEPPMRCHLSPILAERLARSSRTSSGPRAQNLLSLRAAATKAAATRTLGSRHNSSAVNRLRDNLKSRGGSHIGPPSIRCNSRNVRYSDETPRRQRPLITKKHKYKHRYAVTTTTLCGRLQTRRQR